MGCFSTCFGSSKRRRRRSRKPISKTTTCLLDHLQKDESVQDFPVTQLIKEEKIENPVDPSPKSIDEQGEKTNLSGRKKVTFDLNIKIYEELPKEQEEVTVKLGQSNEEERKEKEKKEVKAFESQCPSDSSSSGLFSYPLNHRYQNCRDSDDEFDELLSDQSEIDDDDDDDDDDDGEGESEINSVINNEKTVKMAQDQSSESLFSLSIDSRKHNSGLEADDKEVHSPMPIKNLPPDEPNPVSSNQNPRYDRSKYVDSVLNPVENLTQWKVIKRRSKLGSSEDHHQAKENVNSVQDLNYPVEKEPLEKEFAVDTSLSSWLVGSETVPNSKTSSISVGNSPSKSTTSSPQKFEDRPILGALTMEDIRQFSASTSPRKSPSRSPDDMPIIGTVGSYWSHTEQTIESGSSTRSRFTESSKVIWDSTPFEMKLAKALEEGTAERVLRV